MIKKIKDNEREMILYALDTCKWNRTHAAKKLGISVRTIRTKINEYKKLGYHIPQNPNAWNDLKRIDTKKKNEEMARVRESRKA